MHGKQNVTFFSELCIRC